MASSVTRRRSVRAALSGVRRPGTPALEQRLLPRADTVRRLQEHVEVHARAPVQLVHQPRGVGRLGQPADAGGLRISSLLLETSREPVARADEFGERRLEQDVELAFEIGHLGLAGRTVRSYP